jgi:hypothetical protein
LFIFTLCRLLGGLLYLKKITPYGFFFPGKRFQGDTNSNVECLRRILESIEMEKLPSVLYIQLDNTCKDNKNYKFLLFCGYLLLIGFVDLFILFHVLTFSSLRTIEIYFLPKGHTHGQIDQMFSCFSQYLKKFPAKTLPELLFGLFQSYNNSKKKKARKQTLLGDEKKDLPVITQVVDQVVDFTTWLESMEIPGARGKMGLPLSHAFQLQLHETGDKVLVKSKQWAVSLEWLVSLFVFVVVFLFFVCYYYWFVFISQRRACLCLIDIDLINEIQTQGL